jgi:uncharacterized protein YkwD
MSLLPLSRILLVSTLAVLFLLGLLTAQATAARSTCSGATAAAAGQAVSQHRTAVLCLVNAQRARRGLPPLRANRLLTLAAQRHSRDMVARRFFAHESPNGASVRDRVARTGYLRGGWSLGENIGWMSAPTASGIVQAWMESPGHKAMILHRGFKEAGVGVASGVPTGGSGATYTMNFGRAG